MTLEVTRWDLCSQVDNTVSEVRRERWLREHKALPTGRAWPQPFLQAHHRDIEQAIRRFLDAVAGFRQLT